MSSPVELLGLYLHLARAATLRKRWLVSDRFLVLAAALAEQIDLTPIAEHCRLQVLAHNPGHMLARWPTLAAALAEPDFLSLLNQLLRRYNREKAEQLLQSLGIERGAERAAYYSDGEYAAGLLGVAWRDLEQQFGL